MEKIISIVEHDKDILEKECQVMNQHYENLNKVLSGIKIDVIDIYGMEEIDVVKVLMRSYLAIKLDKEYDDTLFEETHFLDEIISRENAYDMIDVIDCFDLVNEDVSLDDLLGLFKNDKIILDFSKKSAKVRDVTKLSSMIIELKSLVEASNFPMIEMLQYMKSVNNVENVCEAVCYGCCLMIQLDPSYILVESRVSNSFFSSICTSVIEDKAFELDHKTKSTLTDLRKKVNAHEEIIKFLNDNKNKKEIIGIPTSYKKLDKLTQYVFVKSVYEHNMVYNNSIEKQYKKSNQDQVKLRKQLLKKYKVDTNDLFYEYEYDELESILEILSEFKIISDKNIGKIIKNIDINKLETISIQYKLGYIGSEFINKYKDILSSNDDDNYKNLVFNIRKLKEAKISKATVKNNSDILLTDSKIISNSLGVINTYLYQDSLKNTDDISFIKDNKLAAKIDILLELGFESNLDKDLSLLGYNYSRYKRLEICNRLNILPEETDEIKMILDKDKFIIKDECIDDYILHLSTYTNDSNVLIEKEEFQARLNNYQVSNRLYDINGVLISKFKVTQAMENKDLFTGEDIFNILLKNKKIDVNCYNSINGFISQKDMNIQKTKTDGKNC